MLGWIEGARPGPTLLCVGGIHGNEPAGVEALRRILPILQRRRASMSGDVVALVGNRTALERGCRFVDHDLNRLWNGVVGGPDEGWVEERERVELLERIEAVESKARGDLYVLDLHTTSGFGAPFTVVSDTLRSRAFAMHLPVPLVLGLEELVDGTLIDFLGRRGHTTMVFESGQHTEREAVGRAVDGVWLALSGCGILAEAEAPESAEARKRLRRDTQKIPRVLEMRYRHGLEERTGFRMKEGYENFQRVRKGEVLASDDSGPAEATEAGRVLMPLYQELGDEGFFIVREFHPFWLSLSRIVRRLGFDRVTHLLPGVRRVGTVPETLEVDTRIARWWALELLHLLGYRKRSEEGHTLVMVHRAE